MINSSLLSRVRRFRDANSGLAAIEFALILPVMLAMYFGVVEACNSLEAKRKMENVASMTGQLVAQTEVATDDYIANVFSAAEMAFEPYNIVPLKVVVTSIHRVQVNGNWRNEVIWSKGYHDSPHSEGDVINPPDGLLENNRGVILTEVEYLHTSVFADYFSGPLTFKKTFWTHPRYVPSIEFE